MSYPRTSLKKKIKKNLIGQNGRTVDFLFRPTHDPKWFRLRIKVMRETKINGTSGF